MSHASDIFHTYLYTQLFTQKILKNKNKNNLLSVNGIRIRKERVPLYECLSVGRYLQQNTECT